MIIKAIIVPTPRRIKKYFEAVIIEFNLSNLKKEDMYLKHTNLLEDNFKGYGITMKIF